MKKERDRERYVEMSPQSRTYCFLIITNYQLIITKCTIHMLLLQAVYNYRRSPKNRVKHGTMEWSKFVDDWPHSGVSFSECEVVLYFAAYINKYYITQYHVSLY